MKFLEVIIVLIIGTGIVYILWELLKDPSLTVRAFFRLLKPDKYGLRFFFAPVWGPIFVLDKILGMKIYYKNIEEVSDKKIINTNDFQVYFLGSIEDKAWLQKKRELLFVDNGQDTQKTLLQYADRADSLKAKYSLYYNIKCENKLRKDLYIVFVNKKNNADSFYLTFDSAYGLKLVGKTKNKKKSMLIY